MFSYLVTSRMSYNTPLSAMNLALDSLGWTLYWKYWWRQQSFVCTTMAVSFISSDISFIVAPGRWITYFIYWQWTELGSTSLKPKKTSQAPTRCLYIVSNYGTFLGSPLLTGKSLISSSVQIAFLLAFVGLVVALFCGYFGCYDYFFSYFFPIFASTLVKGWAVSFFLPSPPMSPGLRTLPLQGLSTISFSSSQLPTNYLRA